MRLFVAAMTLALIGCGDERDVPLGSPQTTAQGSGGGGATGSTSTGAGGEDASSSTSASSGGGDGCPETPAGVSVGLEVGNQLPELVVRDCDGNAVSLDSFCGADAMFLFALHGWCPICQSVSSDIEATHDGYAGQNLATVVVVVANSQDEPPDAAYCQSVRDQHGHEDVVTLFDPDGVVLPIWNGSSALSAYLDADRVITGKLVHNGSSAAINAEIDKALGN